PQRGDRRPQLNDDHDDLRPCPECGRMNHEDARWCSSCDARLEADEDVPRASRRRFRRDSEPHRGAFVLTMGILSLAITPRVLCVWLAPLFAVLGIVFGLIGWVLGQKDLPKLKDGTMDPEGYSSTQAGWVCGIIGTCLNAFVLLACGGVLGAMWYSHQ